MRRWVAAMVTIGALAAAPAANAGVTDDAQTALNIIPSGQYGSLVPPPGADTQAKMYDALTPLFGNVTDSDLNTDFKSEMFGVGTAGPGTNEPNPCGATITRDSYNVPHIDAATHDAGICAAGWITEEDRGSLLLLARNDAYVAGIDAPGLDAVSLIASLKQFTPSQQTIDEVHKQRQVLLDAGTEGKAVVHDIDTYVGGLNAYIDANSPGTPHFTDTDIFALNALKDQFVGEGGGDEARRSQFLGGLEHRLGVKKGYSVFNDLRQNLNAGSPTTVDGKFNYEHAPKKPGSPGSVVLDPHSFTPTPAAKVSGVAANTEPRRQASNELMIEKKYSTTGHPELVGGPQIGYFYPGFTDEMDMHAGDLQWRGATSANFPGYLLIGRGPDFASTLTSAGSDVIDQFAETLCGGSDTKYLYKGKCKAMQTFDAGTLNGQEVTFKTTVHGPVIGYATVHGKKIAISSKRSSYGKDSLDLLYNRRLSDGQVHSAKTFIKAAALTPQTFNSFYMDDKNVALYTAGLDPIRAKGVDPSLPTVGTGKYEWQGFLSPKKHIQGVDPQNTPVKGTMVNWNNISAHGFGAADDAWGGNGSAARVDMLNKALEQHHQNTSGKWSLASVASAMNQAATQDVRSVDTTPLLAKLLKGSHPPNSQAAQMLSLLKAWNKNGSSRLDLNNDGLIDDPGAAIMDAAWPNIANAFMKPQIGSQEDELASLFSRFDQPPGGQYSGWYQYFDRDVKKLLGIKQPQPFANSYCGGGNLHKCQKAVWGAIASAGQQLTQSKGTADPSQWHADANAERIHFAPGILTTTMRYTNRPSGIQQVISFDRHG
jgi:acyl-homoserine lactone acylase PvdQ